MIRNRRFFGARLRHFTLQWHLTNRCSFHCRHCYDRSDRQELNLPDALAILADFQTFCRKHRLKAHLCLSGGDPMLYPYFWDLYRHIADVPIPVSILGNPIGPDWIEELWRIQPPVYYQVSLEGLREHNDRIRGQGQYGQVMTFLLEARQRDLPTHVMLTLTRANLDQVLPLAQELRGLTECFTFNRLSQVGDGANLELPSRQEFIEFLEHYRIARKTNPLLRFKDNLFNILQYRHHRRPFPGCTGFGCGAAFNFVALLPDGEVHACRKYPSLIGNILQSGMDAIYHSAEAQLYRNGSIACRRCCLRRVCGGCPAVSYGNGLDPLKERDPYCFMVEPM